MDNLKLKAPNTPGFYMMRMPEVRKATGISKTTIWDHVRRGTFPQPVKVSPHCTAWRSDEVSAWMASRERVVTRGENA